MKRSVKTGFASIGFLLSISGMAQASLIANGSFEDGYSGNSSFSTLYTGSTIGTPGWTVTKGSVDWIYNYWPASDGSKSLDLAGISQGEISQSFTTIPGQTYRVQFDIAGNPDLSYDKSLISESTGDSTLALLYVTFLQVANGHQDMGWQTEFFDFIADSSTTVLSFADATDGTPPYYGAALDNVSVDPVVPEPSSLLLVGAGVAGAVIFRRRSRRPVQS